MDTQVRPAVGINGAARTAPPHRADVTLSALTGLASEIMTDAKALAQQHGTLLKAEVKETRNQAVMSVVAVGGGAVAAVLGAGLLVIGLVKLTAWLFPTLPEFAAWLIWGGVLAAAAGIALWLGVRGLTHLNVLPRRTLRSVQESWSCLVNRLK
jgi:hypothetical protein